VTSANEKIANRMVEWVGLADLIDEVVGIKDREDPIPFKRRSIQELRQRYQCEKVYMIGDTDVDMKAGHDAGAVTVLFKPREAVDEFADHIISDFQALLGF